MNTKRYTWPLVAALLLVTMAGVSWAQAPLIGPQAAMGSTITYQGHLVDADGPVNDSCDMSFKLYDAAGSGSPPTGGNQVGPTTPVNGVTVNDGYFGVELDFGSEAFDGDARWLEVAVDCGRGSVTLSPRQALTPAPYALYAPAAASVPWTGVAGVPADLADGDDDTLSGLGSTCSDGQIAEWSGSAWSCGDDTLSSLGSTCSDGQIAEWNGSAWSCGDDDLASGGTSDHGMLSGLSDDDHPQYLHQSLNETLSGRPAFNGGDATNPPFTVDSDTQVPNLNADLLDGQEGSYYRDASNIVDGTLSTTRYSAYADLTDEGRLDNANPSDLLAQFQGDSRYVNEGQTNIIDSGMIVNGQVFADDLSDGAALAEILDDDGPGTGLNADLLDNQQGSYYRDWNNLTNVPGGFSDDVDNVDDSVSWSEISGIVGTGGSEVAAGDHDHFGETWSGSGGYGLRIENSGSYGIRGSTSSGIGGAGVYGHGSTSGTYGVFGTVADGSSDGGHFVDLYSGATSVGVWAGTRSGNAIEAHQVDASGTSLNTIFRVDYQGRVYSDLGYRCGNNINDDDSSGDLSEAEIDPCLHDSSAADFAEMMPATAGLEPGDVLVIGPDGRLARSEGAYAARVVGIYSARPSYLGNASRAEDPDYVPLALVGVVPVKASAENGPITPGDLLVAAATPGHVMRSDPNPPVGTVLGKALEALDGAQGSGLIRMLVMLQ
jgi:hypothetical protein